MWNQRADRRKGGGEGWEVGKWKNSSQDGPEQIEERRRRREMEGLRRQEEEEERRRRERSAAEAARRQAEGQNGRMEEMLMKMQNKMEFMESRIAQCMEAREKQIQGETRHDHKKTMEKHQASGEGRQRKKAPEEDEKGGGETVDLVDLEEMERGGGERL